ncbi:GNAT family protein [Bacillus safensis]|uniref:GNAT family N-acetyltransferase n=1 Tax=Bacillus safensis TaxID=561879 RepID=UPI0022387573|nr:GNAT family protein [Bacillus safensis]MCW4643340.1 GNAT family N-acetyltransferase [Bacillus safensis]MCY7566400.1 GNAT family N-acetyltransferase [Bacillus safensis]MCY7627075.1 GNAT family N-acetyltransferase [Bacillus safensis]MCY7633416.1 GNAT family N-acetyltransferase [Bacillus safensis]MCY7649066.1 GNAT family N-acetyltransferase [Bacillus safensis]
MLRNENISLAHFSETYIEDLKSFDLDKEQAKFTALPSEYFEFTEGQYRIVILNEKEPVGFFVLNATDRVKDYSNNPNALLLTSLSIHQTQQRKGYAKQAMSLLKQFVTFEFPTYNEIVLAVNHQNIPAQTLYSQVSFRDTHRRKTGPHGEQIIMSLLLT